VFAKIIIKENISIEQKYNNNDNHYNCDSKLPPDVAATESI
jgi:hypothetical protein